VFAREPRAGAVKTRLAADLGGAAAAQIYADLLARALQIAETSQFAQCYLFAADPVEIDYFEGRLNPRRWRVRAQCGGDIGRRMHNALAAVLGEHEFSVLIGSDVADCTRADLDLAWATLACGRARAVIGPSADDGYWLIGLTEAHREVFRDIAWSTAAVLAATQSRLAALGLEVVNLTPRHDVDDVGDLCFMRSPDTAAEMGSRRRRNAKG
jgi:hypothetical protein